MMPTSEGGYKQFKIGDLFEKLNLGFKKKVFKKNEDISTIRTAEFNVPLVNAKHGNNGIMYYGREADFDVDEMTIDIVNDGAVSTGDVYPQPQKTGVLYNAYLIKYKDRPITEPMLLYFSCVIEKSIKFKFSYQNKASWDKVKDCLIYLPVDKSNEIDFDFIESRVRELEEERVRELEAYLRVSNFSDCSLTLAEKDALDNFERLTTSIKIGDLFDCKGTKSLDEGKLTFITNGGVNFVTRKSENYGISGQISMQAFEPNAANTITSNVVGRKMVRYQEQPYYCSQNINKLVPKFALNRERAFFIMAHLQKFLSSLGRDYDGYKLEELTEHTIKLPVTLDGSIDYAFMENYIKAIMKQTIAHVKEYIEREHNVYMQVIQSEEPIGQTITPLVYPEYKPGRIPLYTLRAACGYFGEGRLPEEEGWVDATGLGFTPDPKRHFAVHAKGDSMLPKIKDGDLCIFEWYTAGSRDGEIVLTQISEFDDAYDGRYTIKRYHSEKTITDEGWQHSKVELQPLNPDFEPVQISEDEDFRTIGILKCIL